MQEGGRSDPAAFGFQLFPLADSSASQPVRIGARFAGCGCISLKSVLFPLVAAVDGR
jgi:hypothetical protein